MTDHDDLHEELARSVRIDGGMSVITTLAEVFRENADRTGGKDAEQLREYSRHLLRTLPPRPPSDDHRRMAIADSVAMKAVALLKRTRQDDDQRFLRAVIEATHESTSHAALVTACIAVERYGDGAVQAITPGFVLDIGVI